MVAGASAPATPRTASTYENQPLRFASNPPSSRNGGAPADNSSDDDSSSFQFARLLFATGFVVSLIFILRWAARRFFGVAPIASGTRAVQVISRSAIGARQAVVLLRVGKRVLIVADNGSQMSSLGEVTDPTEVAELVSQVRAEKIDVASRTFGSLMSRLRRDEKELSESSEAINSPEAKLDAVDDGESDGSTADAPGLSAARAQLSGLMDQVRLVSSQFGTSVKGER